MRLSIAFRGGLQRGLLGGLMGAILCVSAPGARGDDAALAAGPPASVPGAAALPSPGSAPAPAGALRFNRDIRPILSDNCFKCHGPGAKNAGTALRLDQRDSALEARKGRRAIVPGDAAASELIRRVNHADPEERMPPADSGKTLTDPQKQTLADWIDQGAEYQPHWAFIAPARPEPPKVEGARTAVDAFIRGRLAEAGLAEAGLKPALQPAPQADAATLARRVSFDLTGLPPTPEAVDAFVADPSDAAYEAMVDRLLASPAFGERMAIDWLDQVRYADTNGYHGDNDRSVWPYRDYVIDAFNANKAFNQFTIEQLAGDLLPNPKRDQLVASGFNRLNQITAEGGAQGKEYRAKYNADRVRTVASVWLGATVGCAECHDHKFDPITTKDFYQLSAFFADVEEDDIFTETGKWEPVLPLPNLAQMVRMKKLESEIADLRETVAAPTGELAGAVAAGQAKWEEAALARAGEAGGGWRPSLPAKFSSAGGATLKVMDDFSLLSTGESPLQETYEVEIDTGLKGVTAVRLQALPDPSFRVTFALTRVRVTYAVNEFEAELVDAATGEAKPIKIASAESNTPEGANLKLAIDDDESSSWSGGYALQPGARVEAAFKFAEPIPGGEGTRLRLRIKHHGGAMSDRTIFGRIRFSLTTDAEPKLAAEEGPLEAALKLPPPAARSEAEKEMMAAYYRTVAPKLADARTRLEEARKQYRDVINEMPYTLVTKTRDVPRSVRVLRRGDWMDDGGELVTPGFPKGLGGVGAPGGIEGEGARRLTRLDLANWIVSPSNPLTARVQVNRWWKLFFGRGIAPVLDDLGSQGEWPAQPELLDWLAVEFRESGWDMKHIVRLIVTSDAYRQTSSVGEEARRADPDNRLLARQTPRRLPAEMVRDNALAASGLLNAKLGGPSVRPYQPEGYWDHLNFPERVYKADEDANEWRRGLYTHWQRTFLHPSLKAFDAPSREECVAERPVSNTPLQALALLNDPTYVEAARVLAEKTMRAVANVAASASASASASGNAGAGAGAADLNSRLDWMTRRVLSRRPTEAERKILIDLYGKSLARYGSQPEAAAALDGVGVAPKPEDLPKAELAAWTAVARALLNLHESITRS